MAQLRATVAGVRSQGGSVALVPTMGALHAGHLALVRSAREYVGESVQRPAVVPSGTTGTGYVVVSIFVNPLQFAPHEDYELYPRDLLTDEARLESLAESAPDLVYAPSLSEMYPRAPLTTVSVAQLGQRMEGAARPGHFEGVCLVVSKLLHQVEPDLVLFGRKDYQQLQVVRRMTGDLDLRAKVIGVHTVREPDGLAMSSRNAFLSGADRQAARCLSQALAAAVRSAHETRATKQAPDPEVLRATTLATIRDEPRARVDYVEVADPDTLAPPDEERGEVSSEAGHARGPTAPTPELRGEPHRGQELVTTDHQLLVAVAVHIGQTRLIDNVVVGDLEDERRLLEATS
ncbi:MAG: pantoate--beta-alanine ligase [Nitriliruptorales bacterium]